MMLTPSDLLRPWVLSTLAALATDDEQHARMRETLLVFLQSGGSYHDDRGDVELALRASHWLGSAPRSWMPAAIREMP